MFQGERGKVGRSAMGARERGDGNDSEDDNREYSPEGSEATWALRLSYGVLSV
jgi:hypothetical protein